MLLGVGQAPLFGYQAYFFVEKFEVFPTRLASVRVILINSVYKVALRDVVAFEIPGGGTS